MPYSGIRIDLEFLERPIRMPIRIQGWARSKESEAEASATVPVDNAG
jgi:hypothetical protein